MGPSVDVSYEDLPVDTKKRIISLSPSSINEPPATVIGIFNGDDRIRAIEVDL